MLLAPLKARTPLVLHKAGLIRSLGVPWYTPNLFFPQVSHGEGPPSTHAWVFSGQAGFVGSA